MLSAMDENTTNRILDLEKKVDCLEEEYRRRREEYERNWRFAVQLSYTLDKQLGDKLLEKSGCVNADKLLIFPCISAIQKAILKKRHYKDILDEQQRKVVEQMQGKISSLSALTHPLFSKSLAELQIANFQTEDTENVEAFIQMNKGQASQGAFHLHL